MKKTTRVLRKLLIAVIIIILLNNFFTTPIVRAAENSILEMGQIFLTSFIGGLTFIPRAIALGLGRGINALTAAVAYIEGATDVKVNTTTITPFDIFFNKVKILDINFFEIGDDVNIVNTIRTGIASWYYALRLIAMSILLVILIYVGIRMAISTIASDKAMYKKMFVDWVVSLVLIFLINYIIIFIITLNNTTVAAIEKAVTNKSVADTYKTIMNLGFKVFDVDSIPATVIYCMLIVQVFGLLVSYFNRMLKVAFLIIISPLITLTYAVDKMGDGKAQAFGNWMREFIFTVIIQIFHCIIYMSLINVAFELLIEHAESGVRNSLAAAVMAFLCVNFTRTAEGLVRKILMHNHQDNSVSIAGGTAAAAVALQKSKSLGTATRKAVNVTKQNLRTAGNALKTTGRVVGKVAKVPAKGVAAIALATKDQISWEKIKKDKDYANLKKENKEQYKVKKKDHKVAMKNRRQQKKQQRVDKVKNSKVIKGAVGGVHGLANVKHKLNRIASQSDIYKFTSGIAKTQAAMGVGVLTGSMMYGATGNSGQAFAMGVAGMNMHRGFQKSALTMESRTQSSLIGAGAKTKEEAFAMEHEVASNPYKFDGKSSESLNEAKRLLNAIGKQLEATVGSPEYKTKIKNEIDRMAKTAPEMTPQAILSAFDKIADAASKDSSVDPNKRSETARDLRRKLGANTELQKACNDYARFANMKQIHSQMEAGQAMGISKDAYVQETVQGFVPLETTTSNEVDTSLTSEGKLEILEDSTEEEIETNVTVMSKSEFKEMTAAAATQRKDLEEMKKIANDEQKKEIDEQIKKLEKVESTMASRILSEKKRVADESKKKILEEVSKQCGREIETLLGELNLPEGSSARDLANVVGLQEDDLSTDKLDSIIKQRADDLDKKRKNEKINGTEQELEDSLEKAKKVRQIVQVNDKRKNLLENAQKYSVNK